MNNGTPDPATVHMVDSGGRPATHVLVIGIGHYPRLHDGTGQLSQHAAGMGQLTSPPISARAFANWVIEEFDHPDRPLGSAALVLSEAQPEPFINGKTNAEYNVPAGDADSVVNAIERWSSRCAENPDNLAVFFFCGHGVSEGAVSALLTQDFGFRNGNAFDGAINVGELLAAMQTRLPNRQLFIIDACRVSTPLAAFNRPRTTLGRTCLQAEPMGRLATKEPCLQSVLYSTLEGHAAFGRRSKPSTYTEALLKALKGSGGHSGSGKWVIETTSLQTALHHLLTRGMSLPNRLQVPETTRSATFEVHRPDPVEIATFITCRNLAEMGVATLLCHREGQQIGRVNWQAKDGPYWQLGLEPDRYEFGVEPPDKPAVKKQVMVYGPVTFVELEA